MPRDGRSTARIPVSTKTTWKASSPAPTVARRAADKAPAVLDARPGRPLPADPRLPRCGQRHHAACHAAGRADAGRAHPGWRARRTGIRLQRSGHAGDRRRGTWRRAGGDHRRTASAFRREGDDIIVELPVTLQEAVLGATLEVPTIGGPVRLTIPPNSGPARGSGSADGGSQATGHQFVELHPVLPPVRSRNWPSSCGAGSRATAGSACRHGDRVMV